MINEGLERKILCHVAYVDQWLYVRDTVDRYKVVFMSDIIIEPLSGEILKSRHGGVCGRHYSAMFTESEMTAILLSAVDYSSSATLIEP